MSGVHLDPSGDVYDKARRKIDKLVKDQAMLKHVPVTAEYIEGLPKFIVEGMELRDLMKIVYMPDRDVVDQAIWRANNELDWRAAVITVELFAQAGDIALSQLELCEVAGSVLARMRGIDTEGLATRIWPGAATMAAIARREVARHRPASAAQLETVILPVVLPRPANAAGTAALGTEDMRSCVETAAVLA